MERWIEAGVSRVIKHQHFLSDVVAGALVGHLMALGALLAAPAPAQTGRPQKLASPDAVKAALSGLLAPEQREQVLGTVEIRTLARLDARTIEYRLIARRSGRVTAAAFEGEPGVSGAA